MRMQKESWKRISANKVRNVYYEPISVSFLAKKNYHLIILCSMCQKIIGRLRGFIDLNPSELHSWWCLISWHYYPSWTFHHNITQLAILLKTIKTISKLYDWIIQIEVWAKIDYEILDEKCGNSAAVAPQMDDLFWPSLLLTIITLKS